LQKSFDIGHDLSREQEFVGAGVLITLRLHDYVPWPKPDSIGNRLFVATVKQAQRD
jgi:hypothetical protein